MFDRRDTAVSAVGVVMIIVLTVWLASLIAHIG